MTLIKALHDKAISCPQSPAFRVGEEVWTYARLNAEVEAVACGLAKRGIGEGNRVVLHIANTAELVVAYFVCFRIGAIAAPLNTRLKAAKLRPLLERLHPAFYIGETDLYRHVAAMDASVIPLNARFIVSGAVDDPWAQPWNRLLEERAALQPRRPNVHSAAVLLGTSGTTGQSKFAIHTHATLSATADLARHLGLDASQIAMIALPMVHGYGLFTFLACIWLGTSVVLLERFDPDAALDAIERHRCSWVPAVPAMFAALLDHQQASAPCELAFRRATCARRGCGSSSLFCSGPGCALFREQRKWRAPSLTDASPDR